MRKRSRSGVTEIMNRETGHLMPRAFFHRYWASEDVVLRFGIHKKLDKHRGCVNTLSFNADGNILVSGSDDTMIIMWDWDMGAAKLEAYSGHRNNIFDIKFVPYSDDRRLVTCAADGEVRYCNISESGQVVTKKLVQHEGHAYRLAIEPGNPHSFYSCGHDGLVYHIDLRTESAIPLFRNRSPLLVRSLNAIAMHTRIPNLIAVAGTEEYARLFDIRKQNMDGSTNQSNFYDSFCPPHLIDDNTASITGLAFSEQCELLLSYCDEVIYLFPLDQGIGPDPAKPSPRFPEDYCSVESSPDSASSTQPNGPNLRPEIMTYKGHRNSDTMKGVNFFGPNSEYVISGSDCGRIFVWRKKDGKLLRVMEGDKHIVNCIDSHPKGPVIASSGIENDVKIWIPNATEPVPPINIDKIMEERRGGIRRLAHPQDVIGDVIDLQMFLSSFRIDWLPLDNIDDYIGGLE